MVRLTRSSTAAAAAASSASGTASKTTLDSVLRASKAGVTKRPSKQRLSKKLTNVAVNGVKTVQQTPVVRPASPTATNAPLVFPSASKVLSNIASPLSTTTDDILNEGISHLLRVDPSLAPLIRQHYCHPFSKAGLAETTDPFQSLVSGIISQQVSGAAAKSIKAKFIALYYPKNGDDEDNNGGSSSSDDGDGRFPTPEMVLETDQQTLRSAGLSLRKTEYVKSLAEKFHSGDLSAEVFVGSSDQEIVERLTQVRGIGVWSAQMFLLFSLKRLDIFSSSDLGIQRGMAAFAGRDIAKLKKSSSSSTAAAASKKNKKWKYMAEEEMIEISEKFRPYRSLFMWYMWKVGSVGIEAFSEDAKTTDATKATKPSSEA